MRGYVHAMHHNRIEFASDRLRNIRALIVERRGGADAHEDVRNTIEGLRVDGEVFGSLDWKLESVLELHRG